TSDLLRKPFSSPDYGGVLGNILQYLGDDVVRGYALGLGFEVQNETMTQGGGGHGLDVVETDVETALGEGADLAGEQEALAAARAAAETQVLIGDRHGGFGLGMRGEDEAHGVIL